MKWYIWVVMVWCGALDAAASSSSRPGALTGSAVTTNGSRTVGSALSSSAGSGIGSPPLSRSQSPVGMVLSGSNGSAAGGSRIGGSAVRRLGVGRVPGIEIPLQNAQDWATPTRMQQLSARYRDALASARQKYGIQASDTPEHDFINAVQDAMNQIRESASGDVHLEIGTSSSSSSEDSLEVPESARTTPPIDEGVHSSASADSEEILLQIAAQFKCLQEKAEQDRLIAERERQEADRERAEERRARINQQWHTKFGYGLAIASMVLGTGLTVAFGVIPFVHG